MEDQIVMDNAIDNSEIMDFSNGIKLYKDIKERTDGEIYIGVVGPVRCGKSTFIKRFMDLMVLPAIKDQHKRNRANDELPQSSAGKTIMTTEPKFIPKEAAVISIDDETEVKVRLIDCVGYMTRGAAGHIEDGKERMVKTPWFDYEIPFTTAATIGTKKVITDHSTIGLVITADGSFGDFTKEDYEEGLAQTITELKDIGKPFIVLINSSKPYSESCKNYGKEIADKYDVTTIPVNCSQLKAEDIRDILEKCLMEFPISQINFYMPKWIDLLPDNHEIRSSIISAIKEKIKSLKRMSMISPGVFSDNNCTYISNMKITDKDYSTGEADVYINIVDSYYYDVLSELTGADISNEYELINTIRELSDLKGEYTRVKYAMEQVKSKGYGVVMPSKEEILLDEPEVIKNGAKYGVKIKAIAPSIHMIKADILTEIAPIVGNEDQAKDLIGFIKENAKESDDGIWNTNIFGKTIDQIVNEGIQTKINRLSEETQSKMQDTIGKITNDSRGGVICIIL